MKTYEEMAKYVLEVRNETDKKRKHRIAVAKRVIPAVAGVCGAFIIVFGIWRGYTRPNTLPVTDNIIEAETTSVQGTTMPSTTKESITTFTTTETSGAKTTVSTTNATKAETVVVTTAVTAPQITNISATAPTNTVPQFINTTTSATTVATSLTTREVTTIIVIGGGGIGEEGGDGPSGEGNNDVQTGGYTGGEGGSGGGTSGGSSGGDSSYEKEQWLRLPINKRYPYAYIYDYDNIYISMYRISSDIIGTRIGSAEMLSGQLITGEEQKCPADAYCISGYSSEEVIAIKFQENDEYYLYGRNIIDFYEIMKSISPQQ